MPFWKRGDRASEQSEQTQPSAQPVIGTLPCSERGCTANTGEKCGYVDRRSRACGTAWCPDHQSIVGGTVYCRRHAGVVGALQSGEASMPDLENRAPSLVNWVSRDVEQVIQDIVAGYRTQLGTDRLMTEPVHLNFLGPERARVWERSWKLVDHTGWSLRVALEVDEDRDTEVAVRVGRNIVARVVPPWIAARQRGEQLSPEADRAQREDFYRSLTTTVTAAIEAELQRRV
jgi:hypothetical protein